MESAIRLFKALPIVSKQGQTNEELLKQTISKGFIFAPEIVYNYPDTQGIIELVNKIYGRESTQLNQTFRDDSSSNVYLEASRKAERNVPAQAV